MNAIEVIQKVAEDEVKKLHILEMGVVTSIFPHSKDGDKENYECNVLLKNRDLELRRVPIATQHIGLVQVPNVGDLVLLAFLGGNINAPLVIGRLYNDENRPPVNQAGEIVYESPDPEKSGLRRLYLKFPNGVALILKDDELRVEMGKSVITVKTDGAVIVESSSSVEIRASGDLSLTGQKISIESQQSLEMKAGTTGKLEASATLDLKGAMVNIN